MNENTDMILGGLQSSLKGIEKDFDKLDRKNEQRFSVMKKDFEERFTLIEKKIDGVEKTVQDYKLDRNKVIGIIFGVMGVGGVIVWVLSGLTYISSLEILK